jgi:hypothetical protein
MLREATVKVLTKSMQKTIVVHCNIVRKLGFRYWQPITRNPCACVGKILQRNLPPSRSSHRRQSNPQLLTHRPHMLTQQRVLSFHQRHSILQRRHPRQQAFGFFRTGRFA